MIFKEKHIPNPTVERLPLYLFNLQKMQQMGIDIVSSQQLAEAMGLKAVQIRKDLAYFGDFGQRGVGYEINLLIQQLNYILGIGQQQTMVLLGAGHIGAALAHYRGFSEKGFHIKAIFDADLAKIGKIIAGNKVKPITQLEEVVTALGASIAILAVPDFAAQDLADRLVKVGIKGIWNFAPVSLRLPENIYLYQEHLSGGLLTLSFYVNHGHVNSQP